MMTVTKTIDQPVADGMVLTISEDGSGTLHAGGNGARFSGGGTWMSLSPRLAARFAAAWEAGEIMPANSPVTWRGEMGCMDLVD